MPAIVLEALRLFITFLQQLATLLEAHLAREERREVFRSAQELLDRPVPVSAPRSPSPAPSSTAVDEESDDNTVPTPATTSVTPSHLPSHTRVLAQRRARAATPETTISNAATLPTSPSAWRGQRVPNTTLTAEYERTGLCGHYFHETATPRLPACPVCRSQRTSS
jgi:hypothetical protein